MLVDLCLQGIELSRVILHSFLLTEDVKELAGAELLSHLEDHLFNASREKIQIFQGFNSEVLRGRSVILHALKVSDDVLRMLFLFIDYTLQVIVLFIDFSHDLFLEANLACHSSLHACTLLLVVPTCLENLLKFGDLLLGCHLESFHLVGLVCKGTIET